MSAPSRSTRARGGWEQELKCYVCGKTIHMNGKQASGAMFSYGERRPPGHGWFQRDDGSYARARHGDCSRMRLEAVR